MRECTPALFNQVVDSEQTARVCAEIEDALEKVRRGEMSREDFETFKAEQKKRLAIFTPHAMFPKGRRVNEDAVPSGLSMYDVDHIKSLTQQSLTQQSLTQPSLTPSPSPKGEGSGHVQAKNLEQTEANENYILPSPLGEGSGVRLGQVRPVSLFQRLVEHTLAKEPIADEGMIAELKRLGICLFHVTPSTEGFRLFFVVPEGMNLEEAQKWMSEQLGDADYDGCVKDLARCSFVVPRDYIFYGPDERMWSLTPSPFPRGEGSGHAHAENHTQAEANENYILSSPKGEGSGHTSGQNTSRDDARKNYILPSPLGEGSGVRLFRGIPYSSIISEWWRRNGGVPAVGERNVKLHKLAVNLRAICDNKKEVLMAVMPRFGLSEQELKSIVDSACKEEPKGISKVMQQIVENEEQRLKDEEMNGSWNIDSESEAAANSSLFTLHSSLKSKLPIGLRESLVGVPKSMYMPVLCSVLPIAAAYADGVRVVYCDGNQHHLGLMSIVRGEQASNKSVCKNAVDVWKRQFDEEDALARKREEEWKDRKKGRKANEKAPEDPKVLIRMVPVTVSCSTLLKRFKNSGGHTLYSFGEELDTLRKTNGAGSWSSKYDIYRLSFDKGEWGQDYNSDQAESGVVKVAYNWTMLGTDGALRKCFKQDNIENGLSSRILVAEMPDSSFQKMPKFGKRSAEDEVRIQEAVTRLRSYTGLIDVPRLRKAIEAWVEEKRVEAAKDIDHVKDVYRKRAAVIGFRCGVVFHLLSGRDKESKACLDFALMMAEYCLSQQIKTFGEALQNQYVDARNECKRYGANHSVFDQLGRRSHAMTCVR